jgi:iron complex transport system substrate-binding protein
LRDEEDNIRADWGKSMNKIAVLTFPNNSRLAKSLLLVLSAILLIFLPVACSKSEKTAQPELVSPDGTPKLSVKNAKFFSINYLADDVKLISDSDDRELLLVPRGTAVPRAYADKILVYTPVTRAFFTSSTQVSVLELLENDSVFDSIAAVATDLPDWTMPQVIERFVTGQIHYIAQDHWNAANIEQIITLSPDIVFSSMGDTASTDLCKELDEVDFNYAVVGGFMETSVTAYLEWIKFFAAFYNLDSEADAIYEKKLERLHELGSLTADIPENDRPVVSLGLSFRGIVYAEGGESSMAKEVERAGGTYVFKYLPGTGSVRINLEEFFEKTRNADILLYTSMIFYTPDKQSFLNDSSLFTEFKAFQNDQVYVLAKGYYINSANVDKRFEDIVSILHPELLTDHELTFFKRLTE